MVLMVAWKQNGDYRKNNKKQIEQDMFGPPQVFENTTTGAGDIITEIQHQYDIGGEHGHQRQGSKKCKIASGAYYQ